MDQNNPARFLDTAYNALKANPGATNQILQAAAQGQPVGLRGLAAAAAQQNQQEAQKAMAALQQQGPQPNIVQKLATQGIMSQMDTGLPIAPQMGVPEQMPQQMMAGGGLVAFAGGGNVLPPDVIDAIQSHFAEGGDVRGFAEGETLRLSEYPLRPIGETAKEIIESEYEDVPTEVPAVTYADIPVPGKMGGRGKPAPSFFSMPDVSEFNVADVTPSSGYWQRPGADPSRAVINELLNQVKGSGAVKGLEALFDRAAGAKERWGQRLEDIEARHARHLAGERGTPSASETTGALDYNLRSAEPTRDERIKQVIKTSFEAPTTAPATPTWQQHPDPHTGTPSTPKPLVHPEGAKLDKVFEQSKVDTGTKTTDKEVETGLGALAPGMDMEKMRDLIMGLGGHKEMSPEMLQQLGDLKDSARTSTILQSVLGALGGGLTDPYGGRFALGRAALGALGGYQKGIGSEEEIGRKAFDVLRGYSDAPEEEKTKARDLLFGQLSDAAKLQSSERIADLKGMDAMERLLYTQGQINQRAGQGRPATEAQLAQIQNLALDNAQKRIDSINKQRENSIPAKPPLSAAEEQAIMRDAFATQQQFIQSGGTNLGLGGGQLGSTRPIIQ